MTKRERWHPPLYSTEQHRAVQQLHVFAQGLGVEEVFTPQDARDVLEWLHQACGTYDDNFVQGQPDTTNILLGGRRIGLALVTLSKLKVQLGAAKK